MEDESLTLSVLFYDIKTLMLLFRNNELIWSKAIKLISCRNEEWLELASVFKTLFLDFLWWVLSCSNFNWHWLYVKEALREWLLTGKVKTIGTTLLSINHKKYSKPVSVAIVDKTYHLDKTENLLITYIHLKNKFKIWWNFEFFCQPRKRGQGELWCQLGLCQGQFINFVKLQKTVDNCPIFRRVLSAI